MIQRDPFPVKNISLILFLICLGLLTAYIIFIAVISIRIGLSNSAQDGFIIPVLAGLILCIASLLSFVLSSIFIVNRMKEKDLINL